MSFHREEALVPRLAPAVRPLRPRWPPAVRAFLWMDAVLLVAAVLAAAGLTPMLDRGAGMWTLLALAGSALTAALAALSAFELSVPGRSRAWLLLPVPAFAVWVVGSGLGCLALPGGGADVWGDKPAEALQCLGFLVNTSLPLLALMLFMLWRAAPAMPGRVMAMGAVASAGAAASLLTLIHPHDMSLLDLGAHAVALAVVLAIAAFAARLQPGR